MPKRLRRAYRTAGTPPNPCLSRTRRRSLARFRAPGTAVISLISSPRSFTRRAYAEPAPRFNRGACVKAFAAALAQWAPGATSASDVRKPQNGGGGIRTLDGGKTPHNGFRDRRSQLPATARRAVSSEKRLMRSHRRSLDEAIDLDDFREQVAPDLLPKGRREDDSDGVPPAPRCILARMICSINTGALRPAALRCILRLAIGAAGFEPATPCSQSETRRADSDPAYIICGPSEKIVPRLFPWRPPDRQRNQEKYLFAGYCEG